MVFLVIELGYVVILLLFLRFEYLFSFWKSCFIFYFDGVGGLRHGDKRLIVVRRYGS